VPVSGEDGRGDARAAGRARGSGAFAGCARIRLDHRDGSDTMGLTVTGSGPWYRHPRAGRPRGRGRVEVTEGSCSSKVRGLQVHGHAVDARDRRAEHRG